MGYYPLFLEITDTHCLVIGGGAVAERKALGLLNAGAVVTVISPLVTEKISELVDNKKVRLLRRRFKSGDLKGAGLVIAASSDRAVNEEVRREARALKIPVNVVDDPAGSSFIVPSTVRRGELLIAISTAGGSPALAKRTRLEIENIIGEEYAPFLEIMAALREKLLKNGLKGDKKDRIINELLDSEIPALIKAGDIEGLNRVLNDAAGVSLSALGLNCEKIFSSGNEEGEC